MSLNPQSLQRVVDDPPLPCESRQSNPANVAIVALVILAIVRLLTVAAIAMSAVDVLRRAIEFFQRL
jgi:hypothetical protein